MNNRERVIKRMNKKRRERSANCFEIVSEEFELIFK